MARIDDYIASLGFDLEDLSEMGREEALRIVREFYARCPRTELPECKERLEGDLSAVREAISEAHDELRDLERGELRDELKADLKELKKFLREFEGITNEAYQEQADHFRDASDGRDINVGKGSLKLDEGTYVYTLGAGGGAGLFGNTQNNNPLEGVTRDGTVNGEVIKDVNGDERFTYADIEKAITDHNTGRLDAQNIFINTDSGWHWERQPTGGTGTATFKVTDTASGKFAFITFENEQGATYYFQSGLTDADVPQLETWSENSLKRTFWGDSTKSFWDELHPVTDEERLSAIQGYDDIANNYEEVAQFTDGPLSDKAEEGYKAAVASIFGFIDSGGTDFSLVLSEVLEKWNELELSPEDKSLAIQYLVAMFFLESKPLFTEFIVPAIGALEGFLTYGLTSEEDPTMGAKIAMLILETNAPGGGQYDPATLIQTLFAHKSEDGSGQADGKWTDNTENALVLRKVNELISRGGGTPIQGAADAAALEDKAGLHGNTGTWELSDDAYSEIVKQSSQNAYIDNMLETDGSDSSYSDGITGGDFRMHIQQMFNQLRQKARSIEDTREVIKRFVIQLGDRKDNDVANAVVQLLHDHSPDLFSALVDGPEGQLWAQEMWVIISTGDGDRNDREWLPGQGSGWGRALQPQDWFTADRNDHAEHIDVTYGQLFGS